MENHENPRLKDWMCVYRTQFSDGVLDVIGIFLT